MLCLRVLLDGTTGIISGTPAATGDFTATVKVSNPSGDDTKDMYFRINRGTQTLTFKLISRVKNMGMRI